MSRRRDRPLREEEAILWQKVSRTVTPLKPEAIKPAELLKVEPSIIAPAPVSRDDTASIRSPVRNVRHQPPPRRDRQIDRMTTRKIAKGRISIDARIDLHHMTQDQAHDRLYMFLADCRSRGLRHVLVVTGKGRSFGSEGVLRRVVPLWLKSPRFVDLVSGYSGAGRHHGGDGALYVRLRKITNADGSVRR
ncbi:Smr/MutS family protein [Oricola cellulosilytica]|uniref:DNA mismatch repair protein MutS n=1 Tax=Oricola cellulosilytica TaxID=1429082 RepID=A0A4R0PDX9_9HYPH|nr:Smr/MutS family protein [Oricola cellulosilytica]TCD15995.1 DNA mismatch repair protein MutS [Oricola cellulosilytica]